MTNSNENPLNRVPPAENTHSSAGLSGSEAEIPEKVREQPEQIGHVIESAVVDRVEGNIIVLHVGEHDGKLEVPRQQLGLRVREGDHLKLTFIGHELNAVEKDAGAKERSRLRIQEKLNRLRAGQHLRED